MSGMCFLKNTQEENFCKIIYYSNQKDVSVKKVPLCIPSLNLGSGSVVILCHWPPCWSDQVEWLGQRTGTKQRPVVWSLGVDWGLQSPELLPPSPCSLSIPVTFHPYGPSTVTEATLDARCLSKQNSQISELRGRVVRWSGESVRCMGCKLATSAYYLGPLQIRGKDLERRSS